METKTKNAQSMTDGQAVTTSAEVAQLQAEIARLNEIVSHYVGLYQDVAALAHQAQSALRGRPTPSRGSGD